MSYFVTELANGGGNFYGGWMKNPHSAMISCNDGFRPVSFYIEVIAYKLNLSIYTVNNHRMNILAKLNADNVIEAINRAESSGILY